MEDPSQIWEEKFKTNLKKIGIFLLQNIVLIAIGAVIWSYVIPGIPEMKLFYKLALIEIEILFLCQLAVWIHYNSPVTHKINVGSDGEVNSVEQHSLVNANSRIYQAVHIMGGLVVLAVYFLEKAG